MGAGILTQTDRDHGVALPLTVSSSKIGEYDVHPAAAAFPLIEGSQFDELVADIKNHGLLEPIWAIAAPFENEEDAEYDADWMARECFAHDRQDCEECRERLDDEEVGQILDGRNRLRACLEAGVEPGFRRYEGSDPVSFIVSMNIHRRHLDESQRGMIAARLAQMPRGRPINAGIQALNTTQTAAAGMLNVSRDTVQKGRSVLDHGVPELVEAVDRGYVAISRAAEIAKLEPEQQRHALDPAYGGGKVAGSISGADGYNSDEWYTPQKYVDAARQVLGGFDLDPATCAHAQLRIKAGRFFTKDDDGLAQEWLGRVWLNPPYSQPAASQFAEKLIAEYTAGRVTAAIVVQNASTDTAWFHALAKIGDTCLTRGRINFDREDGIGSQNRYGQVFFYLGKDSDSFASVFSQFGLVGRLRGAE